MPPEAKQLVTDRQYYMDGYLRQNLDIIKQIIYDDWDSLLLFDGPEGAGKSVMAMQVAYYLDPTFDLDRIVFTPEDFEKLVMRLKPGQVAFWDEALSGLDSKSTYDWMNRKIIKILQECRQRNLFMIMVMPTFFEMQKYAAIWRSRALIHVYHDKFQRGRFLFYSSTKKKNLYILGKKFYDYNSVKSDFYGRFTKHYVIDEKAYREKKATSFQAGGVSGIMLRKKTTDKWLFRTWTHMVGQLGMSTAQIGKIANCSHKAVQYRIENPPEIL